MHTPPKIMKVWLTTHCLPLVTLSTVCLLSCCQRLELGSHSTVWFSLTRMKVFLSLKEKRKVTSEAFTDDKKVG